MKQADSTPLRSVVVVDDESEFLERLTSLLEQDGFVVATAETGKAALELIERTRPQLVVADISLSGKSGLDLLLAIRASYPDTPVVLTAASADLEEARLALKHGAFHYLLKPLAPDELRVVCRQAIELGHLKAENRMLKAATEHARSSVSHRLGLVGRPERAAMERAALARVTRFMDEAIAKTPTRVLEQALGEQESAVAVADVLADVLLTDTAEGEWAEALLRGSQAQRALLHDAGGTLTASEVGELLGIGRAAVDKRRRQGALLGLRLPSGDIVYPAAQFAKKDVLPGLPDILGSFRLQDPWMQLDALLAPDPALNGRTAFEALADGDIERVKRLVASHGEQGL